MYNSPITKINKIKILRNLLINITRGGEGGRGGGGGEGEDKIAESRIITLTVPNVMHIFAGASCSSRAPWKRKKKERKRRKKGTTLAYVRTYGTHVWEGREELRRKGRKECKKSGKRGRKKWEEGAGGGRRGERNSFNARALPRFISHLSRRESGSHWVLDGTVTRHLLSGGTRGTWRGRDAWPASDWPIRHGEVGETPRCPQLWTPEKEEVWLFSVVRKRKGRRPHWGMGGHGNGRIRKFGWK